MKPETARKVFMDFTRGVLDRIRERMDEMEAEKTKAGEGKDKVKK